MSETTERVLYVAYVARRLAVSKWTVNRWIKAGRVQVVKVGRHHRIPATELDRLLTEKKPVHGGRNQAAQAASL